MQNDHLDRYRGFDGSPIANNQWFKGKSITSQICGKVKMVSLLILSIPLLYLQYVCLLSVFSLCLSLDDFILGPPSSIIVKVVSPCGFASLSRLCSPVPNKPSAW